MRDCTIKIAKILNVNYSVEDHRTRIFNSQLTSYLKQFGDSLTKYIPTELKNLSSRQLKILLDALMMGDGHVDKIWHHREYYTSSKKLAEDVQELFLKTGSVARILTRKFPNSINTGYKVRERINKKYTQIHKKKIQLQKYNGKVYCATVPNNTLYIRLNGCMPFWIGNTEFYVGPSEEDSGECIKVSRYSPTLLYGTSLLLSCWKLVVSLLYMEN